MFSSKETQELTTAVRELVEVNKALLRKIEGVDIKIGVLANFIGKNSENMPAFGVTR